jgi:hypothetical protein
MVIVYITRHALESDPLQVIPDATRQAVAEREAKRIGLKTEYAHEHDFIELHVSGDADQKMRDFLSALREFGIIGCTVDVNSTQESLELGETAEPFVICVQPPY